MKRFAALLKPASGMCNMECSYCFYKDEIKNRSFNPNRVMSNETTRQFLVKAGINGASEYTFAFQGGEPTLAGLNYFEYFVETAKELLGGATIHYALQTNGYRLSDEWLTFFKRHNFLLGISIDGIRATHDVNRHDLSGKGTFEIIMHNIGRIREAGVEFNVLTVVNAKNAKRIRRIYEVYRKNGFNYQQYIACLDPLGVSNGETPYSLTPDIYGTFMCELFDLWYEDYKQGKQPYIRQFESYLSILAGEVPMECEQRGICSCQMIVESDGSVFPCDFYVLDGYRLGNVNDDDFAFDKLYEKAEPFIAPSRVVHEECSVCPYYALCRNGCRRMRNETGKNIYCEAFKQFFSHIEAYL